MSLNVELCAYVCACERAYLYVCLHTRMFCRVGVHDVSITNNI